MKILILSFYYPPDLSAGSFRVSSLVRAITEMSKNRAEIDVITTTPNRYSEFNTNAPNLEKHENVKIYRVKLPQHNNQISKQCFSFCLFAKQANKIVSSKTYDMIFASSSRLMTALLAAFLSKKYGMPLYLDIRDIFVDTITDVFPMPFSFALYPFISGAERYAINAATGVNLVSAGFLPYFESRYPKKTFKIHTNGIDEEFLKVKSKDNTKQEKESIDVIYAGNIGDGQGLHKIIPELAKKFDGQLTFKVIGDGGKVHLLESKIQALRCKNVKLFKPVNRTELIEIYLSADVLFLHLNSHAAFEKVLPSKLFEYAALDKPIWAGVGGYAAAFMNEKLDNIAIFSPCNAEEAEEVFSHLRITVTQRDQFKNEFSRTKIMKKFAKEVLNLTEKS